MVGGALPDEIDCVSVGPIVDSVWIRLFTDKENLGSNRDSTHQIPLFKSAESIFSLIMCRVANPQLSRHHFERAPQDNPLDEPVNLRKLPQGMVSQLLQMPHCVVGYYGQYPLTSNSLRSSVARAPALIGTG